MKKSCGCCLMAGMLACAVARADYTYSNPIYLDMAADGDLAEALAAYNAAHAGEEGFTDVTLESLTNGAHTACELVKRGAGCLYFTNAIAHASGGFAGPVHIEAGSAYNDIRYGLGRENVDASPTVVHKGAVLTLGVKFKDQHLNQNRIFRIAGAGPKGTGALYLRRAATFTDYAIGDAAGKEVALDDDASIGGGPCFSMSKLTLNDHTFTLTGDSQDTSKGFSYINGDGTIIVSNTALRTYGTVTYQNATKQNRLIVAKDGQLRFWSQTVTGSSLANWTFEFANTTAGSVSLHGNSTMGTRGETYNTFTAPVVLTKTVELAAQGERDGIARTAFTGVISGPAGFTTTQKSYGCTFWLHLYNPANTFQGGLSFNKGIIWPYVNGAIPSGADAGAVTLNRKQTTHTQQGFAYDGIEFPNPAAYDLPALVVKGAYPGRVQAGTGAWKSVTKEDAGTVEYFSEVGAPTLTVKAGTFKLPRGAAPGLWEGVTDCASAAAADTAFTGSDTPTNFVMRGPLVANGANINEYSSKNPTALLYKENLTPTKQNRVITYAGYLWNRTGAPAAWHFDRILTTASRLIIDGTNVWTGSAWSRATNALVVAPGPHAFELRLRDATAPYFNATTMPNWTNYHGLAWAVNPAATPRQDYVCDWTRLNDTGDGALFTRTTNAVDHLPAFGTMTFSPGSTLDVNGNRYAVNVIGGQPAVTSSAADAAAAPALVITNALAVAGADLASGKVFTSAIPVTFAAGAAVRLTGADEIVRQGRTSFPIATTTASFTWQGARPRLVADSRSWHLVATATQLTLEHAAGTSFIIR